MTESSPWGGIYGMNLVRALVTKVRVFLSNKKIGLFIGTWEPMLLQYWPSLKVNEQQNKVIVDYTPSTK